MPASKFKKIVSKYAALFAAISCGSQAAPIITNVTETGGDNEATDTVTAKWTGVTFSNGVAAEFGNPYTVGFFIEDAPAYVDREAQWNGATVDLPIPSYLLGGEYILSGNDNRDNAALRMDVTVTDDVIVYILIDSRLTDGSNANPPESGLPLDQWTTMTWLTTNGFAPVINGYNRTASFDFPDEVGSDEGTAAGANLGVGPGQAINQYYSIYSATKSAGTFSLYQPDNGGRGMYGVVIKQQPGSLNSPPQITNLSPTNNTLFADAAGGISFTATTIAPNSISPTGVKLFLNGTEATGLTVGGTTIARTVTYGGLTANQAYQGRIVATDQAGRSSTNDFSFDTFSSSAIIVEAEDYNFGGGQVKSPLTPNAYLDAVGTVGIDYWDQNPAGLATAYRVADYTSFSTAIDAQRTNFTDVAATDYAVTGVEAGEWLNYTRTIPAGNYRIYLRASSGASQRVQLDKVTGATTSAQTTTPLGVFNLQASATSYVPLTDAGGRAVVLPLSGDTTLRLTALSAFLNLNLNYFVLVPTTDAASGAYISSNGPVGGNQPSGAVVRATASNGTTAAAGVALIFDGVDVSSQATVQPGPGGFSGTYNPPGELAAGSSHDVRLVLTDSGGAKTTNDWSFTVGTGLALATNINTDLGTGVGSGFNVHIHKIRNDAAGIVNSLGRAEDQLANRLIDPNTLDPYVNDAAGPNGNGLSTNLVLNFQQGDSADVPIPTGYIAGDTLFPYVLPSNFIDPNFMALEATAYLELAAGSHRLGVRSDDGFSVAFGPTFGTATTVAGTFTATRGDGLPAGATEFNVFVSEAGLYPVRLLWFEGNGGAALEFYSVDPVTFRRTLINDRSDPAAIKAYLSRSTEIFVPTVTLLSPIAQVYPFFPTNIALQAFPQATGATITKVEYYNGTNKIAESTTSPFWSSLSVTEPNKFSISARATDSQGFVAVSETVNLVVGNLIAINFQMPTSVTPAGYQPDSGLVYGDLGNGFTYGWDEDNTANSRERNSALSPDKRYDTFNHLQKTNPGRTWMIFVPNGRYKVYGVAGESDNFDSVFDLLLEDQPFIKGTANTNARWVEGTAIVTVNDGQLTLSNGPTGANNKICFLDIYSFPESASPAPEIAATFVGGNIQITWTGGGMLQSRTAVDSGAWTDVNNTGTHSEPAGSGNKFFRVSR